MTAERACRSCGCTDDRACVTEAGPCSWVSADLCSACSVLSLSIQSPARSVSTPDVSVWEPRTPGETAHAAGRGSHLVMARAHLPRRTVQKSRLCHNPADLEPRDAHRAISGGPRGTGEYRRGRRLPGRGRAGP